MSNGVSKDAALLLLVTAAIEVGAGLALLVAPAALITLLFGPDTALVAAVGVARLAGSALLALGVACWLARGGAGTAARPIVGGMLVYNTTAAGLIIAGQLGALGSLQWAAASLHVVMGIWCVRVVAR